MLLVVAVVLFRLFGKAIPGSYELIELMIVVTVAFALSYTALKQSHVVVDLLVSRFPLRTQTILAIFTYFLSMVIWGLIVWASYDIMLEKWLLEQSYLLKIPYLPFRIVWVFGLLIFSLIFLLEMYKALKQVVSR